MNIPIPDKATRERWWLLCYAVTSMQHASHTANQLVSFCKSNRDPLFLPLAVAAHTFYARPFSHSKGNGRLEEKLVPSDQFGLHQWLMAFRMKTYCHIDATNILDSDEVWNDVVFEIDGGIKRITTKATSAQVENYIHAIKHFDAMKQVFSCEINQLNELYRDLIPLKTGSYELRADMPGNQLFIPCIPTQRMPLQFNG